MFRKTIASEVTLKGIGLHTGVESAMVFKPYEKEGIYFLRTDIKGSEPIKAALENVSSTMRGTNLKHGRAEVHTIEHVLSACAATGVTDMLIEMDGPEPPIMDGSSLVFANELIKAGTKTLHTPMPKLKLNKKIEMRDGNVYYKAEPSDTLTYSFLYLHKHPLVSRLEYSLIFSPENYLKEISPARTFGFEEELEFLRKNGLAKGGSTENAVVITKDGFSSPLRMEGEMVRHKILDMVGDFTLIGRALENVSIYAECGGHKYNVEFGKMLLEESLKEEAAGL
ncbi:UDP-3-O-[3-hydroxymyristoyl] N-acetylglucosamine deacetylase [Parelusimicrobium proximum]|uniref:UDP-3-O-acyl-N-acetylglucosamine deacetylase n=1 Tax=Parelusimicrobium proximum TaxID=3228953 RepID=UPI003D176A49